jgi:hypothetical protein
MAPSVIPDDAIKGDPRRILKYPGIKEDVYVPSFKPMSGVRRQLAIEESEILVTMRPPATEAHYHVPASDTLFSEAVKYVAATRATRMVMLPRNDKQAQALRSMWHELCRSNKIVIPNQVVSGLDLVWESDLVISGGGTMNREAAALGVPVYSVFKGKTGAVDKYLASRGRLVMLEDSQQVHTKLLLKQRTRTSSPLAASQLALNTIVNHIMTIAEAACSQ